MKTLIHAIFKSPTYMTWASYFVKFGAAIFVLPVILLTFQEAEIAVWLLFNLILSLALIADSGFGPTLIRASSYFYAGAKVIPSTIDEFKKSKNDCKLINYEGLRNLLNTANIAYFALGVLSVVILMIIGKFLVDNAINMTNNVEELNVAFNIILIRSFLAIQFVKWGSFIQGIDRVATIKKAEAIVESFKIFFMFSALMMGYGILELMVVELLFTVIILFYARYYVKQWFRSNQEVYVSKLKYNKVIMTTLWPSTWRFGLMQYGGFMTNNGAAIVVSQLNSPQLIASFLLTQKIIFFIRQVSQAPLYSNLPKVFNLMSKNDFHGVKELSVRGIAIGLYLQFTALLMMIFFGPFMLNYFGIEVVLAPLHIMLIMSIAIMLELHHAYHVQIYMGSNHVPFLLPSLISGVVIVSIGFGVVDTYGLLGIVLAQAVVQLLFNNWYPVYLNLKLLSWPLGTYLNDLTRVSAFWVRR